MGGGASCPFGSYREPRQPHSCRTCPCGPGQGCSVGPGGEEVICDHCPPGAAGNSLLASALPFHTGVLGAGQIHTILSAQLACDTAAPACGGVFGPQGLGKHTKTSGKSSHLNVAWVEKGWVGEGGEQKIRKKTNKKLLVEGQLWHPVFKSVYGALCIGRGGDDSRAAVVPALKGLNTPISVGRKQ